MFLILGVVSSHHDVPKKTHVHIESEGEAKVTKETKYSFSTPANYFYSLYEKYVPGSSYMTKWGSAITTALLGTAISIPVLGTLFFGTVLMMEILRRAYNEWAFQKQLKSTFVGPIVAMNEFCICFGESQHQNFSNFIAKHAVPYFSKANGLQRFQVLRGINSNRWVTIGEWQTLEDYRKAISTPEWKQAKRQAPWNVFTCGVKKTIHQTPPALSFGVPGPAAPSTARKVL
jgi:heme-degrading monooxygenase HmoA